MDPFEGDSGVTYEAAEPYVRDMTSTGGVHSLGRRYTIDKLSRGCARASGAKVQEMGCDCTESELGKPRRRERAQTNPKGS